MRGTLINDIWFRSSVLPSKLTGMDPAAAATPPPQPTIPVHELATPVHEPPNSGTELEILTGFDGELVPHGPVQAVPSWGLLLVLAAAAALAVASILQLVTGRHRAEHAH